MTDDPVLELTTDQALLESVSPHYLDDLKLEPFSLMRQAIATDLCDRNGGTFFSAIMTVWVCTLSEDEALEAHATDKKEAQKRAFKWGEGRGYSLWNWRPVVNIYDQLNREWSAVAKARVADAGGNGEAPDPNAGGRPA